MRGERTPERCSRAAPQERTHRSPGVDDARKITEQDRHRTPNAGDKPTTDNRTSLERDNNTATAETGAVSAQSTSDLATLRHSRCKKREKTGSRSRKARRREANYNIHQLQGGLNLYYNMGAYEHQCLVGIPTPHIFLPHCRSLNLSPTNTPYSSTPITLPTYNYTHTEHTRINSPIQQAAIAATHTPPQYTHRGKQINLHPSNNQHHQQENPKTQQYTIKKLTSATPDRAPPHRPAPFTQAPPYSRTHTVDRHASYTPLRSRTFPQRPDRPDPTIPWTPPTTCTPNQPHPTPLPIPPDNRPKTPIQQNLRHPTNY